jgi:endonuclease/exonuclease/phosphatase family metal-dependent hydrolase
MSAVDQDRAGRAGSRQCRHRVLPEGVDRQHHKDLSFNRKFILPELREAVRSVDADVFLQEVTSHRARRQVRALSGDAALRVSGGRNLAALTIRNNAVYNQATTATR